MNEVQQKYYDLFMRSHTLQTELQEMPSDRLSPEYRLKVRGLVQVYIVLGDWYHANNLISRIITAAGKQPGVELSWPEAMQLATMLVVNLLEGKPAPWQERMQPVLRAMLERSDAVEKSGAELFALLEVADLVQDIRQKMITAQTTRRMDQLEKKYAYEFYMLGFLPTELVVWEVRERYYFLKGDYQAALGCLPWIESLAAKSEFDFLRVNVYQMAMHAQARLGNYQQAVEEHERHVELRDKLASAQNYAYSEYLIAVYGLEQKRRLLEKMRTENRRLEEQSEIDPLTRLYNRQYLERFMDTRTKEKSVEFTAVMIDIDFFKAYNDHYGHIQGDTVLSEAGRILWERRMDGWTPVRYGGEEFLLLKETSIAEALAVAEEVRQALFTRALPHRFSAAESVVTLSAGIAARRCEGRRDFERLIGEADAALYEAKKQGRNRCARYEKKAVGA